VAEAFVLLCVVMSVGARCILETNLKSVMFNYYVYNVPSACAAAPTEHRLHHINEIRGVVDVFM